MVETPIEAWLADGAIRAAYGAAMLKYDIAYALVTSRTQCHLTQAALAQMAGVSQAYLASVERGEANPSLSRLGAMVASMGMKLQISIVPLLGSACEKERRV